MEEDVTGVGNAVTSVPMSATPSTSTPRFVFGETSEIQPSYHTTSQTTVEWTNNLPPFLKSPKVSGGFPKFVPMTSWPSFEHGIRLSQPTTPISSVLRDSAAQGSANAEVSSGNMTPTGQASLPPGAQKAISEICDQYLRQLGINPDQSAQGNAATANLVNPSSFSASNSSFPSSSGVLNSERTPPPVIPLTPISVSSTSPNGGGNGPFSRIAQARNPQPPQSTFAIAL